MTLIEEKLRFLDEIRKYENIFGYENMETSAYEDAEYFFQSAISQNTGRLDDLLISSFL